MFKCSRLRSALTAGRRVKEAELLLSQNKPHVDGNEQQRETGGGAGERQGRGGEIGTNRRSRRWTQWERTGGENGQKPRGRMNRGGIKTTADSAVRDLVKL